MTAFKKVVDTITSIALILVVVFAFLLVGVRIFGLTPYTVLSGSMEPEYHVGALIYVKKTTPAELGVNDCITYTIGEGTIVTHRIVEVIETDDPNDVSYKTKGDANDVEDGEPVHISRVIGKVVFDLPLLGYVSYYIRTPVGIGVAVSAIILLLFLAFVPDIVRTILADTKKSDENAEIEAEIAAAKARIDELITKKDPEEPVSEENGTSQDIS